MVKQADAWGRDTLAKVGAERWHKAEKDRLKANEALREHRYRWCRAHSGFLEMMILMHPVQLHCRHGDCMPLCLGSLQNLCCLNKLCISLEADLELSLAQVYGFRGALSQD